MLKRCMQPLPSSRGHVAAQVELGGHYCALLPEGSQEATSPNLSFTSFSALSAKVMARQKRSIVLCSFREQGTEEERSLWLAGFHGRAGSVRERKCGNQSNENS
ncbi:unnamed protein product [Symbiodinium natans]|uniref:Uncharacterized protein n=1 Tax=Symbiodinium natans TaxID=878477 RepID=A0A812V9F0_9DINO|nr:unnamed protein product [Symbiodinium natans]